MRVFFNFCYYTMNSHTSIFLIFCIILGLYVYCNKNSRIEINETEYIVYYKQDKPKPKKMIRDGTLYTIGTPTSTHDIKLIASEFKPADNKYKIV